MKQMKNLTIKIILLSTFASGILLGATPNIGDVEKQIKTPDVKKEQSVIPQIKTPEYKAPMSDSGKKILVKDFKLTNNEHIDTSKFTQLFDTYKNKELTFNELQKIVAIITKFYRENGYFVARAYIPVQDLKANDNVLEISVIEGNYGEFKLKNNSLINHSVVQGMLDDAKNRDNVISTNTLERAMLIINDTPGAIVTSADVMPGSKVGTSDFEITTQASPRFDGYVVADNTGSRYTGENRAMAGINVNSPFDIGDKISMFGLVSNDQNLKNGKIGYSAPLASNGLLGELSYSQTNYSLADTYKDLDATGTSKTIEAKISYPIIKTREENLDVYTSIFSKDLKDEVKSTSDITNKDSKFLRVGLDYDKSYSMFDKNSNSKINTYLTYGKLSFDDAIKQADDEAGANTNGNYSKVNVDLSHNIAFTKELSLESSLQLQYALGNKNLDGSEDISIGGSNGVKLYPDGELSAENGYVFSTELKYQLPQFNSLNSTLGMFYDRGKAFMANNTTSFESKSLQDVGIGLYNSYDKFFSKVQVAWNANSEDVTSEPNRNSRVLFQGGLIF